jgi:N-acetylmuramoyl-L-alanine amidase
MMCAAWPITRASRADDAWAQAAGGRGEAADVDGDGAFIASLTPNGSALPSLPLITDTQPDAQPQGEDAPPLCPPGDGLSRLRHVVIDPGHGGLNEGAIGHAQIFEKHLTLDVAQHLKDRLAVCYPALTVTLTRDADVDLGLAERARMANDLGADLLISLHLNAAENPDARGHETFWLADTRPVLPSGAPAQLALWGVLADLPAQGQRRMESAALAADFAQRLHEQARGGLPDSLDRGIKRANFAVLRHAQVPAVVVELGFLSHADEGLLLAQPAHQALWVQALMAALAAADAAPKVPDLSLYAPVPSAL